MGDARRYGRSGDDRDIKAKAAPWRDGTRATQASRETDRLGRDEQRRATAYGRARGQL